MRLNCVCSCSSARGRRSGPGGWPGRSSRFLYQSQGCKEGRDCGGSHEPLNVREAGLLTVIEGCTAEQLKLGGGLCPLMVGGKVQKLRPDQQRPLRAPHHRGQVLRAGRGQVLGARGALRDAAGHEARGVGAGPEPRPGRRLARRARRHLPVHQQPARGHGARHPELLRVRHGAPAAHPGGGRQQGGAPLPHPAAAAAGD